MLAYKGSFGFDSVIPFDSLTIILFSCSEKLLRRTCGQQRVRAEFEQLVFFDGQNHNGGIDAFA